jgi:serine/threonine protein phosphatase PrpC
MSTISTESMEVASRSDCGRVRSGNEDACGFDLPLGIFAVCDGMGGAAAGEIASQLAVESILEHWRKTSEENDAPASTKEKTPAKKKPVDIPTRLRAAIQEANSRILRRAAKDTKLHGMGTTAVVLYAEPADSAATIWIAHAGDSRAYRFRAGALHQLTTDHSLVEEQIRLGHMTAAQAENSPFRNVITRAVGATSTIDADVHHEEAQPCDIYLLCSDGLTRELPDAQIAGILAMHAADTQTATSGSLPAPHTEMDAACEHLISAANDHGGRDNITCILVRVS